MNINLQPNITGTNVNLVKGATQADLTNAVNNSRTYRDESEAFSIVSENKSIVATDSASSAYSSATTASNAANTAITKANEANSSAISASASETVCIAKATIATDKADIATAQAVIATNKAIEANNDADTATTQAGIAITKASEASVSASNALVSANNADTSEANALTYRNQAESFANSINPSDLVHISGTETITGNKTFSGTVSGLTKATVGLSNVNNTSDANKPISNAVQTALGLKADNATTLGGYGITDAYTKTSTDSLIDIHSKTAKTTLVDADEFMTADSTSTFSLKKITWASIKTLLANLFIPKVTSTDNAVVRFDGTTGDVQNSGVIIDDNNNVGIGGTPDSKLSIFGTAGTNPYVHIKDANGADLYLQAVGNSDVRVGSASNHNLLLMTNGSTKVTLDTNGNVGVGVTPSAWGGGHTRAIDIGPATDNGTIWSSLHQNHSHIGIGANFYTDSSVTPKYKASYPASQYEQENGNHYWRTAPSGTAGNPITWTNTMSLYDNGSLRLGTFNAVHNVISKASGADYVVSIVNTSTTGESYNTRLRNESSSTIGYYLVCESPVGLKAGVLNNGSFVSATGSYGQYSDIKLKENINDASPKLDKLMQVKIKTFNYIGQEEKQIGVIAQEIEQIFPSLVFETKDTKDVEVEKEREITHEDGTVNIEKYTETQTVETGEVTKNVKYSILYTLMLKGIQEQQEIINDLKARIEILEGAK